MFATLLVSIWIVDSAMCMVELEGLVYKALFDPKDSADVFYRETLLIGQDWDPCLQILRDTVWRHMGEMSHLVLDCDSQM